jgi:hypothetical protein
MEDQPGGNGGKRPPTKFFLPLHDTLRPVGDFVATRLSPTRIQNNLRKRLTAAFKRALGVHWPPWLGGYLNTCPALDAMAFFAAWLTLAIISATGQEWLKPIVWPTALLFLIVFLGHWARDYLRDVRRSQDLANSAFLMALIIAVILGADIATKVLHHVNPRSPPMAGAASPTPSKNVASPTPEPTRVVAPAIPPTTNATPTPKSTLRPKPSVAPLQTSTPVMQGQQGFRDNLTYRKFHATPLQTTPPTPIPQSFIDVHISGDPKTPGQTIVNLTNRDKNGAIAENLCAFVYPLFSGDSPSAHYTVQPGLHITETLHLFPGDTQPSPSMEVLAHSERPWVTATQQIPAVDKVYAYHSYTNQMGQTVEHDDAFTAFGAGFFPIQVSSLPQGAELMRVARILCGHK